jgi:hypothetical protein
MIKVITYGTNKQAYFDLFMESCKRHAIEPVLLGWGEPWIGFGKKITDIRNYAAALPASETILVVDPYDVIFLCGLDEIEQKFKASGTKILCGAMKFRKVMQKVYNAEFNKTSLPTPKTLYGYDFVNSGTLITTAGYAVTLIDRFISEFSMTPFTMDQEIFTTIYITSSGEVDIDWKCEIFHNLLFKNIVIRKPDLKDIEFVNGRIFNTSTKTYPCIIHASGNALMEDIARLLGYDGETIKPVKNNINFMKKALFHIRQLHRKIIAAAFILVLIGTIWLYLLKFISAHAQ